MSRTPTKPPDDKLMWKRVLKPLHPDLGGRHEDFVWLNHVKELVCSGRIGGQSAPPRREPRPELPPKPEPRIVHEDGRVPFPESADFEKLTARALEVAAEVGGVFAVPLRHLADCRPLPHLAHEQERGSSYKRLAYIAHLRGMDKPQRVEWYRVCESIPLPDRCAGHVLSKLKRQAA